MSRGSYLQSEQEKSKLRDWMDNLERKEMEKSADLELTLLQVPTMRLEFSAPLSRKRLAFSIHADLT